MGTLRPAVPAAGLGERIAAPGTIRVRAPLRISFAGGGTDVMPYPRDHRGCVLSATIDLYAWASLRPRPDSEYQVVAENGSSARYASPEDMVLDGHLDLVKGCLPRMADETGLDLHLCCDAPPGSGLGSSSALVMAMLAAVAEQTHTPMTPYELAGRAYQVERVDLRQPGGMQHQYCAAFVRLELHRVPRRRKGGGESPADPHRGRQRAPRLAPPLLHRHDPEVPRDPAAAGPRIRSGRRESVETLGRIKELTLEMRRRC